MTPPLSDATCPKDWGYGASLFSEFLERGLARGRRGNFECSVAVTQKEYPIIKRCSWNRGFRTLIRSLPCFGPSWREQT